VDRALPGKTIIPDFYTHVCTIYVVIYNGLRENRSEVYGRQVYLVDI